METLLAFFSNKDFFKSWSKVTLWLNRLRKHWATHEQLTIPLNKLPCHIASVHKQEEDSEKNYVCDLCGYRTDKRDNLTKHHKGVHNKQACPYCDHKAASKNNLELHMDKKHQEEHGGELNHICSQCGKGFIFKYSLTDHLR